MNKFTIRMQSTTLSSYSTYAWQGTGWTTVYQTNQTISSTGWTTFNFTTPFAYDGVSNLMVDFSFNDSSYSSYGYTYDTYATQTRELYYYTDNSYGDPLTVGPFLALLRTPTRISPISGCRWGRRCHRRADHGGPGGWRVDGKPDCLAGGRRHVPVGLRRQRARRLRQQHLQRGGQALYWSASRQTSPRARARRPARSAFPWRRPPI